jgi:hypothetical protein
VEMTSCKQSSSSPLVHFISLLVIRVCLIRITKMISYQFTLQKKRHLLTCLLFTNFAMSPFF